MTGRGRPFPHSPRLDLGGVVDIHAHAYLGGYIEFAEKHGVALPGYRASAPNAPVAFATSPASDSEEGVTKRLQLMDEAGVSLQVITPALMPYFADRDLAIAATRLSNDAIVRMIDRAPSRLAAFVSLPLPHVDEALAELRRGLDELGMQGATMQCACLGESIAEDRYEPLFAELDARGAVLFLHPAVNGLCSHLLNDWNLASTLGALFEDTTVVLHLIARSIPIRFPNIRIIVPHLGGGLPMFLERLDNQLRLAIGELPQAPSLTARSLWYDTVAHGSKTALRAAVDAFGASRLLAGSDFPVLLPFGAYGQSFGYIRDAGLDAAEIEALLRSNARALLAPPCR